MKISTNNPANPAARAWLEPLLNPPGVSCTDEEIRRVINAARRDKKTVTVFNTRDIGRPCIAVEITGTDYRLISAENPRHAEKFLRNIGLSAQ